MTLGQLFEMMRRWPRPETKGGQPLELDAVDYTAETSRVGFVWPVYFSPALHQLVVERQLLRHVLTVVAFGVARAPRRCSHADFFVELRNPRARLGLRVGSRSVERNGKRQPALFVDLLEFHPLADPDEEVEHDE